MTTRKSKRQKLTPYDFLAIPLRDGSFSLAEFVGKGDSGERFCVLYRLRESSPDALREGLQTVKLADVVGVTAVSTLEIERGDWVVLGSHASVE